MVKTRIPLWVGTIALIGAIAYSLTLFIGTPRAAAGAGPQSNSAAQSSPVAELAKAPTYEGVITDTHCGAKHSAPLAETAAECTRVCVHAGERFALVDGDKMYVLEGEPAALKRAAGERVTVAGTLNGNTISVISVRSPKSSADLP
jgi:hypothetical protein